MCCARPSRIEEEQAVTAAKAKLVANLAKARAAKAAKPCVHAGLCAAADRGRYKFIFCPTPGSGVVVSSSRPIKGIPEQFLKR